jgi:polyphenol oxidase
MQWIEHEGRRGLVFDHLPNDFPIVHVFTAKQSDGSGNVSLSGGRNAELALAERRSWSRYLGADPQRWVVGGQTHQDHVAVVQASHCGSGALTPKTVLPHTDGMLTITPTVPLYVAGADCATVLLACASPTPTVSVIHAGWRGAAAQIVRKGLAAFLQTSGAEVSQVYAGVAPCIGAASFEVGDEVAEQVPEAWRHQPGPKWHVDLAGWIGQQLLDGGIPKHQLQLSEMDTMAENHQFFSHRGDGAATGRQGLIAMIRE